MSVTLYLRHGDCVAVLREHPEGSVGAVVSDPPYGLEFMGKEWDNLQSHSAQGQRKGDAARITSVEAVGGFQDGAGGNPFSRSRIRFGRRAKWEDGGDSPDPSIGGNMTAHLNAMQEWHHAWLVECYRVLVPGGVLKAFSGTRTLHRLAGAMREAGFTEISVEAWAYGSGFPKSMSIGKALDRTAGKTTDDIRCLKRELQRVFALSNLTLAQLNAGCGFEASGYLRESSTWVNVLPSPEKWWRMREVIGCDAEFGDSFRAAERAVVGESPWSNSANHFIPGENHKDRVRLPVTAPATDAARTWEGWGTALKPSWEPVLVGRKPCAP